MQRILPTLLPGLDLIDLRLYTMVQASLFFSLLISGSISLLVKNSWATFLLLGGNVLLHLLLDALQNKWANGVHLFAPFSWQLTEFKLFWPEQMPSYLLTLLGLLVLVYFGRIDRYRSVCCTVGRSRLTFSVFFLGIYLCTPPLFFSGPLQADNHFVATVQHEEQRSGRYVEFDRCTYNPITSTIRIFSGETLNIHGMDRPPRRCGKISVQGRFTDEDTLRILASHTHSRFRDISSLIGLGAIAWLWMVALLKKQCTFIFVNS